MLQREPALGDSGAVGADPPRRAPSRPSAPALTSRAPVVYVVGFWRRFAAAAIDAAIIAPTALIVFWIASAALDVHLPAMKIGLFDIDLWIDLVLAMDPGLVMALILWVAIGLMYLLLFHIVRGQTVGMRAMKMTIIDVYGDRPAPLRCALRVAGYLASAATLFLGFFWIGFDSEKRGLHDWIAGTYVVRT